MKILQTLGVGIFTVFLIVIGIMGFDYILCDDTEAMTRLTIHEMYEQGHIDSIFLGASHVTRGMNTEIADKILGENTFNCGTAEQSVDGSYALLKEANKTGNLKKCYLEISVQGIYKEKERIQKVATLTYIISDYMKMSYDKVSYLLNAMEPENYINAFCRARRSWETIYSPDEIQRVISAKSQDDYKNYENLSNYAGKGFFNATVSFHNIRTSEKGAAGGAISEHYRYYFGKIVQYCQENDIELICYSAPITEFRTEMTGNYDVFVMHAKCLCEEYGIPYYDFNLANPSILNLKDKEFMDDNHLNGKGAAKFSKVFAEFFAGNIPEEDLFYDTYAEKKEHLKQRFIGVIIERNEGEDVVRIKPLATKEDEYVYEIFYVDKNKNDVLLREKSQDKEVKLPTTGEINLRVKVYDSQDNKVGNYRKKL